jgi:hypothetical protein
MNKLTVSEYDLVMSGLAVGQLLPCYGQTGALWHHWSLHAR